MPMLSKGDLVGDFNISTDDIDRIRIFSHDKFTESIEANRQLRQDLDMAKNEMFMELEPLKQELEQLKQTLEEIKSGKG